LVRTSFIIVVLALVLILAVAAAVALQLLYHGVREGEKPQVQLDVEAVVRSMVGDVPMGVEVSSSEFTLGGVIPRVYTCDGEDVSPPLRWSSVKDAKYYAVLMVDPDAPKGLFIHWVIYNIPSNTTALEAGVPKKEEVPGLGQQSLNNFGKVGYGGPCPPRGSKHRYVFIVLALRDRANIEPGSPPRETIDSIKKLAISYGYTYAYYGR